MKMMAEDIKEIKIKTDHIFMIYKDKSEVYRDVLKISKNWISYKRNNFFDEHKYDRSWDYKTDSKEFENRFELLCHDILNLESPRTRSTDSGEFDVIITFNDESKKEIKFTGSFDQTPSLIRIAATINMMIPNKEPISGLMNFVNNFSFPKNEIYRFILLLSDLGKISLMSSSYPEWVYELFDRVPPNYKYHEITDKLISRNIPISSFDLEEIRAMLTYIMREEHFSSGSILKKIKDGTILKLLLRMDELISEE